LLATKDSLFNREKIQQVQSITFKEELRERERQQQLVLERTEFRNKIKIYVILAIAIAFLSIAIILWRYNKQKQKANILLNKKNEEIQKALTELKSTQAQLVQSEKMASLGELTAGIAHEIENPLNFVNNFSEVSMELVDELKKEAIAGNKEEAVAIAEDIAVNLNKVLNHGKRADSIVKSMMEHSRPGNSEKQRTDINGLAEEYLRLAYHGLRAKDKTFNAEMKTDYDASIGKINVVSPDIGRVLLNLYNNAFYAVAEKKKAQGEAYKPLVTVSSKRIRDRIEIWVADNGTGIPQKAKEKVFQPFFTTKPAGQGTGLGLSLSYDIIKAHGGEIRVESKEGEGAEFVIQLPIEENS
jgi:signal transduction histidine kinase